MYPSNINENRDSPRSSAPSMEFSQYGSVSVPAPGQPPPPHQFGQYIPAPPQYVQYPQYQGQYSTGHPVQSTIRGPWSTGLCDCWLDVPHCCLTCWCPCITFGQIAEIVDKGSTSCGVHGGLYALINLMSGCGCLYSCVYRSKMRRQFVLRETPCQDFLVHCCCEPCALCQEYRELQNRGFDVSIGWDGNAERNNLGVVMPPVIHGAMTR